MFNFENISHFFKQFYPGRGLLAGHGENCVGHGHQSMLMKLVGPSGWPGATPGQLGCLHP